MPSFKIRGIDVDFPFSPYGCQLMYMEKVIQGLQEENNMLLESPTGTGKTLCLLCASLSWLNSYKEIARGVTTYPKIIFTSRTHSQLGQVVSELKHTPYRPKISILGSRQQLCIHPQISLARGAAQNNMCKRAIVSKTCEYNNNLNESKHLVREQASKEPLDIEEMYEFGKYHHVCPYYLSREMHTHADIVFMPYNYLIDPKLRRTVNVELSGSVIICDEAHNLESWCSDAASFEFSASSLTGGIAESQFCIEVIEQMQESPPDGKKEEELQEMHQLFSRILNTLLEMEREITYLLQSSNGSDVTRDGEWIYELFANSGINSQYADDIKKGVEKAISILTEKGSRFSSPLHFLSDITKILFSEELSPDDVSRYYRVNISSTRSRIRISKANMPYYEQAHHHVSPDLSKGYTLSFWCFNPGIAMRSIRDANPRSILLTSGTLSPMQSFASELQLEFPIRLENPHVIAPDQVCIMLTTNGPSGKPLNSSYSKRDSPAYRNELGNSLVNLSRIIPDGMLVFFPSYSLLKKCVDAWKSPPDPQSPSIWENMSKEKQLFVEPRDTAELAHTVNSFEDYISSDKGSVFFAVCRGKVSEGLDFANRNGRAVVITGLPYPASTDTRVQLKRKYLDREKQRVTGTGQYSLSGTDWYLQQGTRAVNQAIGRVIRHRNDYGSVILLDERFVQQRDKLSKWLQPYIRKTGKFGEVITTLTRFYRNARTRYPYDPQHDRKAVRKSSAQLIREIDSTPTTAAEEEPQTSVSNVLEYEAGNNAIGSVNAMYNASNLHQPQQFHGNTALYSDNYHFSSSQEGKESNPSKIITHSISTPSTSTSTLSSSSSISSVSRNDRSSSIHSSIMDSKHSIQYQNNNHNNINNINNNNNNNITTNNNKNFNDHINSNMNHSSIHNSTPPITSRSSSSSSDSHHPKSSRKLKARSYLDQAKSVLNDSDYTAFKQMLVEFKRGFSETVAKHQSRTQFFERFVFKLSRLFSQYPQHKQDLLLGFKEFISPELHPLFLRLANEQVHVVADESNNNNYNNRDSNVSTDSSRSGNHAPISQSSDTSSQGSNVSSKKRTRVGYDVITGQKVKKRPRLMSNIQEQDNQSSQEINEKNKCMICCEKFKDPHVARCGHTFCHECWLSWLTHRIECPICREKVREKHLRRVYL